MEEYRKGVTRRFFSSDFVRLTGLFLAILLLAYVIDTVYKHADSYEGFVIEKDRIEGVRAARFYSGCSILLARDDGTTRLAELGSPCCASVSRGNYVVKRRGWRCPEVVHREKQIQVPIPGRNPGLSRQLEDFDKTE